MAKFIELVSSNKSVVARMILFGFAWFNSFLAERGLQPLPVLDEASVSYFLTFVISVWTLAADNKIQKRDE